MPPAKLKYGFNFLSQEPLKSKFLVLQTTQLANGVTVASLDTGAGVSSVAIMVKAGTRHETTENLGTYKQTISIVGSTL